MVAPDGTVELADGRKVTPSGAIAESSGGGGGGGSSAWQITADGKNSTMLLEGGEGGEGGKMMTVGAAQAMINRLQATIESMKVEMDDMKKVAAERKKEVRDNMAPATIEFKLLSLRQLTTPITTIITTDVTTLDFHFTE